MESEESLVIEMLHILGKYQQSIQLQARLDLNFIRLKGIGHFFETLSVGSVLDTDHS